MADNDNRSDLAKKCYTPFLSEDEIEKELYLIFEPQICQECGQDHSFKNGFENVETSIDCLLKLIGNRRTITIVTGGNLGS